MGVATLGARVAIPVGFTLAVRLGPGDLLRHADSYHLRLEGGEDEADAAAVAAAEGHERVRRRHRRFGCSC